MSLTIDNTTHWKSSNVETLVRAAMKEAGAVSAEPRTVRVRYQKKKAGSRVSFLYSPITELRKEGVVELFLPKRGPKDIHPNAMVALAVAADVADSGISKETNVLAVSDTWFLANGLAFQFARESSNNYVETEGGSLRKKREALRPHERSIQCPGWGETRQFFITQYKNPKLDGTYLAMVKKKQSAIKLQETLIAKAEKELKAVQKRLRGAKSRKKAAEKSLKDMAARRS